MIVLFYNTRRKYSFNRRELALLVTIRNIAQYVDQEIKLGVWLYNKRSSGKIQFLQLRDGTGFIQGVVVKSEVPEQVWSDSKSLTQESSLYVTGIVREDQRSKLGYELTITNVEVIQIAGEYPITKKNMVPIF